ncbi:MAG: hypothetical protein KatS3mg105_1457 [Gemmatales bacterium]|nr:MAG: hypothetical protein KatS3mg105_1457 [Gemmatales bacterium]
MIERLYVNNFRCLENFSLDLAGRSSALLIGKNGCGKSTVSKALELLQSICRQGARIGKRITPADFTRHQSDRPMRFALEFVVDSSRLEYTFALDWPPGFHEARIVDEKLTADGQVQFTRQQGQVRLADGNEFGLDWHVFALPVIRERQGRSILQNVKSFLATMIVVAPDPTQMSGYSREPTTELEYNAANYTSCLRALLDRKPAAYGIFESYIKTVLSDFSSIENVDHGDAGTQLVVEFKHGDPVCGLPVGFQALSDGEKCFFLSAYIIAANAVGNATVCVWDEPDSHLSLPEVGHFITSLRKMACQRGQFIATTHHPETIRRFSDDSTFVLSRTSHLDPVTVRPLADLNYQGDLVHALLRDEIISRQ